MNIGYYIQGSRLLFAQKKQGSALVGPKVTNSAPQSKPPGARAAWPRLWTGGQESHHQPGRRGGEGASY